MLQYTLGNSERKDPHEVQMIFSGCGRKFNRFMVSVTLLPCWTLQAGLWLALAKTSPFVMLLCLNARQFYSSKESLWVGMG